MARILVIDDEADVRRLLRKLIEADGHQVLEAQNAAEAQGALAWRPDGVLVDVSMPGETGIEFLQKLRAHPTLGQTPAMFVTAHVDRALPLQQQGLAGPHVIHKPFRHEEIRDAVRTLLRCRRRRVEARVRLVRETVHAAVDDDSPAVVRNLSPGGLFVETKSRRSLGQNVALFITYLETQLACRARVTHAGREGLGLAFIDPGTTFLTTINATIEDLLTEGSQSDDRRRATRTLVSAAVIIADTEGRKDARLRDLSLTGAFIVTSNAPAMGAQVFVYLPGYTFSEGTRRRSEVRGCPAEVVRHEGDGFGCMFRQPSAEFRMAIEDLTSSDGEEMLVGI